LKGEVRYTSLMKAFPAEAEAGRANELFKARREANAKWRYNSYKRMAEQIPVNAVQNLYIDTCWFDAPTHHFNQLEILNVRIVNRSQSDYPQIPVNFYLNDSLKALAATELKAGEQKVITLQYSNTNMGFQQGRIEISDYPIVYDNVIYLAYHVKNELKALLIETNEVVTTRNFRAMFRNDPYIRLEIEKADRLQISSLPEYSSIILNELRSISSGLMKN
jgi:hypothetical protein